MSAAVPAELSGDGLLDVPSTSVQWTGLMAMVVSIFIMITSFQFVRNLAYQVFMLSHILGWVALLVSS